MNVYKSDVQHDLETGSKQLVNKKRHAVQRNDQHDEAVICAALHGRAQGVAAIVTAHCTSVRCLKSGNETLAKRP
jgi:hypothetical protein